MDEKFTEQEKDIVKKHNIKPKKLNLKTGNNV